LRHQRIRKTIFLLYCTEELLDRIADRDEMVIYNKNKMFLESFIKETKQEFEDFKPKDVQKILLSLINEEFNIETYYKQRIILEHFPVHNFK